MFYTDFLSFKKADVNYRTIYHVNNLKFCFISLDRIKPENSSRFLVLLISSFSYGKKSVSIFTHKHDKYIPTNLQQSTRNVAIFWQTEDIIKEQREKDILL